MRLPRSDPRFFADAVKFAVHARVRNMHQIMTEFVKHHEQFFIMPQAAVDRDIVTARYAVVKSAHPKRHLLHRYPMPLAEPVKVVLRQRPPVPVRTHPGYFVEEEYI